MARKKDWLSVGIRLAIVATLFLSWNKDNVDATFAIQRMFKAFKTTQVDDKVLADLCKKVMKEIFRAKHQSQMESIEAKGDTKLNDNEQLFKKSIPGGSKMTNLELRKFKNDKLLEQWTFQTLAIAVNQYLKTLVAAGNFKLFNADNVLVKTQGKELKYFFEVLRVGWQDPDILVATKIFKEEFSGFKIVIVQASNEDMERIRDLEMERHKRIKKGQADVIPQHDLANAKAHTFHAEMVILSWIRKNLQKLGKNMDGLGHNLVGWVFAASKQFCIHCGANIPKNWQGVLEGLPYGKSIMRWAMPKNPKEITMEQISPDSTQSSSNSPQNNNNQDPQDTKPPTEFSCPLGKGRRRRRSRCSRYEDVTDVNADKLQQKIQNSPEAEQGKLLSALDQVGLDKLKGSESAQKKIKGYWKKWKSSVVKGVTDVLSKGTIIAHLLGSKSLDFSKTAISPKLITESLDRMYDEQIQSAEEEKTKGQNKINSKGLRIADKVVKRVNLGMMGKNLIGGVLNGDTQSLMIMGGLLGADTLILTPLGEVMSAQGQAIKLAKAGHKVTGNILRATGPMVGAATSLYSVYSLIQNVNQIKSLKEMCQKKEHLFQERVENDCNFDMDKAIADTVTDVVGIVSTVAIVGAKIAQSFSYAAAAAGPVGVVVVVMDVAVSIGAQIYAAVQQVAKISSSLVGGLTGSEKYSTGWRLFLNMKPPEHIQKLVDKKESYNSLVAQAVAALKANGNYSTYVIPTNHTRSKIKVNCRRSRRSYHGIGRPPPKEYCDYQQEFENDSEADFQNRSSRRLFRVAPDTPSWGHLECKPNAPKNSNYRHDPQSNGYGNDYLCHNVIAMTAPGRENLPALIDLKDGDDFVMGFPNRKHVFLVGDGWKNFTGGSDDDLFVLNAFPFHGTLDGAGGTNTLLLNYDSLKRTRIDFSKTKCPPFSNCAGNFKNFHWIIGRTNEAEKIVTACFLTYVNLNGGKSATDRDEIKIPPSDCSATLSIELHSFTKLYNYHEAHGDFTYLVKFAEAAQVNLNPEKNTHRFNFTNDIVNAQITHESGQLFITNKSENKQFQCNFTKVNSASFILMNQAGLFIEFDQDSEIFFGLFDSSSLPLGSDVHEVNGLLNNPNRFKVSTNSNMNLKLTGGDKDDIFALSGSFPPDGSIDGSGGSDSLIFQKDFQPKEAISVDLLSQVLSPGRMKFFNIETIIGRPELAEKVTGNCELVYVDLFGGSENQNDTIQLAPQLSCNSKITLRVRKYTTVENLALSGDFSYQIETSAKPQTNFIHVDMGKHVRATHKYIFLRNPSSVTEIEFEQVSKKLKIHSQNDFWAGTIPIERSMIYMGDQMEVQVLPEVHGIFRVQPSISASVLTGLENYPNTFIVGMSHRDSIFTGGRMDDGFFITSESFLGKMDGGEGINTLFLTDSMWDEKIVVVDLVMNSLAVKSGNEMEYPLELSNIQRVFGREGQSDAILSGCSTKLVDTKGGRNESPVLYNLVHITSLPDCFAVLDVIIRPNLVVVNEATEGEFKYEGDFRNGGGSTSIFLTFTPDTYHKVYLDMDFPEYNNLQLENGHLNITALDGSQFSVDFFIPHGADSHTQPSISFRDGLELKIFGNGLITSTLFGTLQNGNPVDMLQEYIQDKSEHNSKRKRRAADDIDRNELIQKYRTAAKDTLTSVVMQIELDTFISIGSGGNFDILTAVPGYSKNVLLCNSANATVYRIANGSSNVQIIFDLESPRLKLLDLTPIVKGEFDIFPILEVVLGHDLMFQIKDVGITIKGLANTSYEFLTSWQVLLRERFLNIEEDSGMFRLVAEPIVIDPKTVDSFVVDIASLESDTQILTPFNNESHPIKYEAVKQGDHLVFTNLFEQHSSNDVVSSVVLFDFYKDKTPEVLQEKRVMFEVEAGVMMNVTMETGENLPTFEQREYETFGQINPFVFIVPVLVTFLIGIALLCWSKKWYKSLKVFVGNYGLIPTTLQAKEKKMLISATGLKTHVKLNDYELIPTSKGKERSIDTDLRPSYKLLLDLPAKFKIIEKPLPIFQGLLRLQNFNSYDRYCGSFIQCLEGFIPVPNVLVRAIFSPQADCIRVAENGTDFVVALPTEYVSDVAKVLFTLCLRKRTAVIRTDQGEIIQGIRRIMQVLRPACTDFIKQERSPRMEMIAGGVLFAPRFVRFVLRVMEGKEYQAVVNTEDQFRLLDEPESALSSFDELRFRIQTNPNQCRASLGKEYMEEELEAACLQELNDTI